MTRALVATLTGIFANWLWLFIIIGIFSIGEFVTMYKVLAHSNIDDKKENLTSFEKGSILGQVFLSALLAFITTVALACIIRLIKLLIIKII